MKTEQYVWAGLRIVLGLVFFWAFIDKLFGLGFATTVEKSWLAGGSPTTGFLTAGVHGPFAWFYNTLAGSAVVDWLFMMGLMLMGISLILGVGVRIAGYSGALLMFLMWTALLPPKNHPFLDEHVIYLIVLLGLVHVRAGRWYGLGKQWEKLPLVKKFPLLV